jgi:hypothetical protein
MSVDPEQEGSKRWGTGTVERKLFYFLVPATPPVDQSHTGQK